MKNKIELSWLEGLNTDKFAWKVDVKDMLVPALAPESNCPFSKMKAFWSGAKNVWDDVSLIHERAIHEPEQDIGTKTLRTCWGAVELFKNSLVVLSPTDMVISYSKDRAYAKSSPMSSPLFNITQHPIKQTEFEGGGNILDGRIALKLTMPFNIKVKSKSMFLNPTWHNGDVPWKVMSGLMPDTTVQPSLFLDLPLPEKEGEINHLQIKSGEALAYWYFFDDVNLKNIEVVPDLKYKVRSKFMRGLF